MREISIIQLIVISIGALFNIVIFILIESLFWTPYFFIFLTSLGHWANTFYLSAVFVCDISVFFFKSDKLETFNAFMRNTYSIYSFTFEYMITVLYWSLVLLGDHFIRFNTNNGYAIFFGVYLHGIVTVFLLLDLAFFPHKRIQWSNYDLILLSVLYLLYIIIVSVAKFGFNINPYEFMYEATAGQLIISLLSFYLILVNSYSAHLWFIKLRNNLSGNHQPKEVKLNELSATDKETNSIS